MREILFRGKRMDNGEWIFGYYFQKKNLFSEDGLPVKHCISDDPPFGAEVEPKTVGQYTGMKDKNGKRIFEDDVCRFREWSKGEMCWVGKVHWEHQQFMISGGPNKECETMFELCLSRFIPENIEVIGNVHDNPELMEK